MDVDRLVRAGRRSLHVVVEEVVVAKGWLLMWEPRLCFRMRPKYSYVELLKLDIASMASGRYLWVLGP